LHFPNIGFNTDGHNSQESKERFLKEVDLMKVPFTVKIADCGLSKIVN
jgi:hypothetical protein